MNYENVTFIEYQEKKRKVMNSLGRKSGRCNGVSCAKCPLGNHRMFCGELETMEPLEAIEAIMDYEIPIDWTKIEVDTPVLVRGFVTGEWHRRYFARYENGKVYAWKDGATSWSAEDDNECVVFWEYAKLYEKEDAGK